MPDYVLCWQPTDVVPASLVTSPTSPYLPPSRGGEPRAEPGMSANGYPDPNGVLEPLHDNYLLLLAARNRFLVPGSSDVIPISERWYAVLGFSSGFI